jgi:hypothetical protein
VLYHRGTPKGFLAVRQTSHLILAVIYINSQEIYKEHSSYINFINGLSIQEGYIHLYITEQREEG